MSKDKLPLTRTSAGACLIESKNWSLLLYFGSGNYLTGYRKGRIQI